MCCTSHKKIENTFKSLFKLTNYKTTLQMTLLQSHFHNLILFTIKYLLTYCLLSSSKCNYLTISKYFHILNYNFNFCVKYFTKSSYKLLTHNY